MNYADIIALPHDFNRDYDEVNQYVCQLVSLRNKAIEHPLRIGNDFVVDIVGYDNDPDRRYPVGARPLPSFAHSSASRRLVLEMPLQTKLGFLSQVWIARVVSSDAPAPTDSDPKSDRVILKFFQPSLLRRPYPDVPDMLSGYVPPKILALKEDCIYRMLKSLQGLTVPYHFGIFNVTMPNGEDAHMLVIEYVEGITLKSWMNDHNGPSNEDGLRTLDTAEVSIVQNMFMSSLIGMKAIHDLGVVHGDVRERNMIVYPPSDPTQVVFIDFAQSFMVTEDPWRPERETYRCYFLLSCCGNHSQALKAWTLEHLPEGFEDPFSLETEETEEED